MIDGVGVVIVGGLLIALLPRRAAAIPLLLTAAYTTRVPVLALGPANLSALRILVLVGIVRVVGRRERMANGLNQTDGFLFAWATFLICVSLFHNTAAWTFRLGLMLGEVGVYFLCRVFIQNAEDARWLFKVLCLSIVPLALLMVLEKYSAYNYFGGELNFRDGHVRAYGPFGHPILAGTAGATFVPLALCLWRTHRLTALLGLCAAVAIVLATTSSGPVMMVVFICLSLTIWRFRDRLGAIRWAAVAAVIGLQLVMNDPVYFLIARIDLTGSSTGWHRAQLIRSAIEHFDEWWAVGTDYTRHWMATGIPANDINTDITNHFLMMGVWGGLPLLTLFVLMLMACFRALGRALKENAGRSPEHAFFVWTLGTLLFGHVINFWSITLFDQSISFFYLVLATIGAIQVPVPSVARPALSRPQHRNRGLPPSRAVTVPVRTTVDASLAAPSLLAGRVRSPVRRQCIDSNRESNNSNG